MTVEGAGGAAASTGSGSGAGPPGGRDEAAEGRALVATSLLALVPVAHLATVPAVGAVAGGADAVTALALLSGVGLLLAAGFPDFRREVDLPFLLLLGFAAYVAASGLWSATPAYAVVKGVGYASLAASAWFVARSGISWERAADAWLLGAALALGVAAVGVVLLLATGGGLEGGPFALVGERMVYRGGSVQGIGFPRLRGPFTHPNLLGEYLVVTAILLWARRGAWLGGAAGALRRAGGWSLAVAAGLAAAAAVPSALVVAGPLLALLGGRVLRAGRAASASATGGRAPDAPAGEAPRRTPVRALAWAALLAGAAVGLAVAAGLLLPVEVALGPVAVSTNGIRPRLWGATLATAAGAPLFGVGATPLPASLPADPGGAVRLWEAHSLYLGVLAQFGIAGSALLAAGVAGLVRGVVRRRRAVAAGRDAATAVLLALAAVGVHGLFSGSEDFRHVWLLFGMLGVVIAQGERE